MSTRLACGQTFGVFSWLITDVGGPSHCECWYPQVGSPWVLEESSRATHEGQVCKEHSSMMSPSVSAARFLPCLSSFPDLPQWWIINCKWNKPFIPIYCSKGPGRVALINEVDLSLMNKCSVIRTSLAGRQATYSQKDVRDKSVFF